MTESANHDPFAGANRPRLGRDEAVRTEVIPGIWLEVLATGNGVMMTRVTAKKGALLPEHSHPHEQCGYVVSGLLRIRIDGEDHDLGPGCTYFVPGDVVHSATALEDFDVIDAFSPPREDYVDLSRSGQG